MRGQTFFWVHYKLVIELLKHKHFLTNYLKVQILASYNNNMNRAKIWICSVLTLDIDNVKIDNVTFHEQQECGYGFPSLPLATRASADVSEWFLSKSGEATSA